MRIPFSRAWAAWLFCSLVGTVLIVLPDSNRRVFSISEGHGPGITDLVGALVLTTGWAVLDVQTWLGRRRLLALRRPRLLLLVVAGVGGAVVVAWSVGRDAGMWWLPGAALSAAAQLVAAVLATDVEGGGPRGPLTKITAPPWSGAEPGEEKLNSRSLPAPASGCEDTSSASRGPSRCAEHGGATT